jgi:hypothetical protein
MKTFAGFAALVLVSACMAAPEPAPAPMAAPATPRDRVIAAIEANGCQLDPSNANAVLDATGMGNTQLADIGAQLVSEGLADVSTVGVFELKTDNCI